MPEGPSIIILREQAAVFAGAAVREVSGNSRIDLQRMQGQRVRSVRSFGKQFLLEFEGFALRIHLLLFGSWRINERRESPPRVSLVFDTGELNFYACSATYVEGPLELAYDWSHDVMSEQWDAAEAGRRLQAMGQTLVCDALLDQDLFAGVGNIIKNEVLFRIRVHPLSQVGALPSELLERLVDEARRYSFEFLDWKKAFVLKQHWQVHTRSQCPHCGGPLTRAVLGRTRRRSFFCERCQLLYGTALPLPVADAEEASDE